MELVLLHFGFFMFRPFQSLLCVVSNKCLFTELRGVVTSAVIRASKLNDGGAPVDRD